MAESPKAASGIRTALIGALALALVIGVGLAWPKGSWSRKGPPLSASGWAPYWQPEASLASFTANAAMFADVSLVAYSATGATSISRYPAITDAVLETFRAAASSAHVPLIATIIDDSTAGQMAGVLADPTTRTAHVSTIVDIVRNGGFGGVDLDYESFAFKDQRTTWATTRPNWIAFLTELATQLHSIDAQLVVSVPPIYDAGQTDISGYWVYDHAAMGAIVDRIRVMAYDYSTEGGKPGPIAPYEWVRSIVDTLRHLVPPAKLDLGVPVYGYDWIIGITGACPADQTPQNDVISTAHIGRIIVERGLTSIWDQVTHEPVINYVDTLTGTDSAGTPVTCTVSRTIHYLDAAAVHDRAYLAHRNDLHGVAIWALGYDDPAVWQGIAAARRGEEVWSDGG
jgi:spore germination protein YaaH